MIEVVIGFILDVIIIGMLYYNMKQKPPMITPQPEIIPMTAIPPQTVVRQAPDIPVTIDAPDDVIVKARVTVWDDAALVKLEHKQELEKILDEQK